MWHGSSPAKRHILKRYRLPISLPPAVPKPWFLQGFRCRSATRSVSICDGFLALQHDFAAQQPTFAGFAGLHARNLFASRKNIGPTFVEGLRAPHNCRIENL
jgi:hypothetical protein